MNVAYKVALITVLICLSLSVLFSLGLGGSAFLLILGAVYTFCSVPVFFIGIIVKNREYRKAFLLTAGILLLLGMCICGPMLIGAW